MLRCKRSALSASHTVEKEDKPAHFWLDFSFLPPALKLELLPAYRFFESWNPQDALIHLCRPFHTWNYRTTSQIPNHFCYTLYC